MSAANAAKAWAEPQGDFGEYPGAAQGGAYAKAGRDYAEQCPPQADAAGETGKAVRSEKRDRMRRTVDIANVSINATQLAAVLGVAWLLATSYERMLNRIEGLDVRMVQTQSQLGEVNARLAQLERDAR